MIGVWYQPNLKLPDGSNWLDRWIGRADVIFGADDKGNPANQAWVDECAKRGFSVVVKDTTLNGPNIIGTMVGFDEPNGKNVPASKVIDAAVALRMAWHDLPVFLSLAGDAVLNGNPWKPADYQALAKVVDFVGVNFYSMNRNASRYPTSHTATVVTKLKGMVPGWNVIAFVECSHQRLPHWYDSTGKPIGGGSFGRCPTPAEMEQTIAQAKQAGADAFAYFPTATGNYGGAWGWPAAYDPCPPEIVAKQRELFNPMAAEVERLKRENAILQSRITAAKAALQ